MTEKQRKDRVLAVYLDFLRKAADDEDVCDARALAHSCKLLQSYKAESYDVRVYSVDSTEGEAQCAVITAYFLEDTLTEMTQCFESFLHFYRNAEIVL